MPPNGGKANITQKTAREGRPEGRSQRSTHTNHKLGSENTQQWGGRTVAEEIDATIVFAAIS